ncbi:hypothetical protein BDN70DRAFT_915558 [Pholiota conissans]|uniref:PHD-type domain-containing protein n=1 Tax=Pholiota conissans TaxID=109636 RepID=A0A9P6CPB3_9AGAR|nr:hypothetical protein BDN70DRAFT_915558 [Pholiota conissans]
MPRRSTARASIQPSAPTTAPQPPHSDPYSDNVALLRRQWRWAAFSQFFCTFSQLFAMEDVTVADIENDLLYQTSAVIPRIMQRLLYTLSYDRKVTTDNWQAALRKQYVKRDTQANPLGVEPKDSKYVKDEEDEIAPIDQELIDSTSVTNDDMNVDDAPSTSAEASASSKLLLEDPSAQKTEIQSRQPSIAGKRASSEANISPQDDDTEQEKPVDWFVLPLLTKLETLHTLAEWQFQNPTRLRTIMRTDDEMASWRIEPIGYDSKHNAYWYIGSDRLWIQRVPPKAPRSKVLKRKRGPEKKAQETKASATPVKRARIAAAPVTPSSPASGRHSRAAKDQAKLKLDAQAKELAELNRQAAMSTSRSTRPTRQAASRAQPSRTSTRVAAPPRILGTRASARLRGPQEEDEWQPIPEEWLNEGKRMRNSSAAAKTGLESDDESISDLTELSDDGEEDTTPTSRNGKPSKGVANSNATESKAIEVAEEKTEEPGNPIENFVEWETICATLYEWEHIAERFEKATHYAEKALYKTLVNDIVPFVTNELKQIERKREIEEALVHRKRSSRLAVRESEREEARMAAKRKQEEDEKMSRARRLEARQQKEEAERVKRELAREQRRKEREAREESRKGRATVSEEVQPEPEPEKPEKAKQKKGDEPTPKARNRSEKRAKTNGHSGTPSGTASGSRTPAGEDWEVACEICLRHGMNIDLDTDLMSCERCSRWQHMSCHDSADKAAGRPLRNWKEVEFICKSCRAQQRRSRDYYPPVTQHPSVYQNNVQAQPYRSYPYPAMTNTPVDSRASQYMAPYRDTAQQSYYVRTPANGQLVPPQGRYPVSSSSSSSYPTSSYPGPGHNGSGQSSIFFSHYQPDAHAFSNRYSNDHSGQHQSYHNSAQQYNHATQPSPQPSQHYRTDLPYKAQQQSIPAWNITTPAHAPGYPAATAHNGTGSPGPALYRTTSLPVGTQDTISPSEHPQTQLQTSYSRYPADQYYPPAQYKSHSTSYQPPLGR